MNPTAKNQAIQAARDWVALDPLIFDTETTNVDGKAEAVEIAFMDVRGNVVFHALIKPQSPSTLESEMIHGLTQEMLADKVTWDEIHDQVLLVVKDRPLIAFNAPFDKRILKQSAKAVGLAWPELEVLCAMKLYSHFIGQPNSSGKGYKSQKLIHGAMHFGIGNETQDHRAVGDCQHTLNILNGIARCESDNAC